MCRAGFSSGLFGLGLSRVGLGSGSGFHKCLSGLLGPGINKAYYLPKADIYNIKRLKVNIFILMPANKARYKN